jgi:hypothetical protein
MLPLVALLSVLSAPRLTSPRSSLLRLSGGASGTGETVLVTVRAMLHSNKETATSVEARTLWMGPDRFLSLHHLCSLSSPAHHALV